MRSYWYPVIFLISLAAIVWGADCYETTVLLDDPCGYFRMDSPTCTGDTREGNQSTAAGAGFCNNKLTASSTPVVRGTPGIPGSGGDAASLFSQGHYLYDTGDFNDCIGDSEGTARPCVSGTPKDFTVEGWFKVASPQVGPIVGKLPIGPLVPLTEPYAYTLSVNASREIVCVQYDNQLGGDYAVVQATPTYALDTWTQVACTVTASPYALKVWVNGAEAGSTSSVVGSEPCGSFGNFMVGVVGPHWTPTPDPQQFWIDGFIDEVATYNRVLTSTQMGNHYTAGIVASFCSGGDWPFTVQDDHNILDPPYEVTQRQLVEDAFVIKVTNPDICGGMFERRPFSG